MIESDFFPSKRHFQMGLLPWGITTPILNMKIFFNLVIDHNL
jgi:hypothetical protein